jgi:hypothetical protein
MRNKKGRNSAKAELRPYAGVRKPWVYPRATRDRKREHSNSTSLPACVKLRLEKKRRESPQIAKSEYDGACYIEKGAMKARRVSKGVAGINSRRPLAYAAGFQRRGRDAGFISFRLAANA